MKNGKHPVQNLPALIGTVDDKVLIYLIISLVVFPFNCIKLPLTRIQSLAVVADGRLKSKQLLSPQNEATFCFTARISLDSLPLKMFNSNIMQGATKYKYGHLLLPSISWAFINSVRNATASLGWKTDPKPLEQNNPSHPPGNHQRRNLMVSPAPDVAEGYDCQCNNGMATVQTCILHRHGR